MRSEEKPEYMGDTLFKPFGSSVPSSSVALRATVSYSKPQCPHLPNGTNPCHSVPTLMVAWDSLWLWGPTVMEKNASSPAIPWGSRDPWGSFLSSQGSK